VESAVAVEAHHDEVAAAFLGDLEDPLGSPAGDDA